VRLLRATLILATALAALPAAASAESVTSSLGMPCVPAENGAQRCTGTMATRVPSWDGVPLDVNVTYPPADREGPFPLVIRLHGFSLSKDQTEFEATAAEFALKGYAVLAYTARGAGFSCGLPVSRVDGCERGWTHLADARYEARDAQHLAGLLVDEGRVLPRKIGATGSSYGGGTSLLLAALRDRTMLPDGTFVPWRSPAGVPMELAAAAPYIGFTDLAYALVPNGRKLDTRARNPYGGTVGVTKESYLQVLYALGENAGYYAPPGADPEADIVNWYDRIMAGEPYGTPDVRALIASFTRYRSAYYLQDRLPRAQQKPPAPLMIFNAWTDDIMPANQAITFLGKMRARFPRSRIGVVLADGFGHPRADLTGDRELPDAQRWVLFDRYLLGDRKAKPLVGVMTRTQGCNGLEPQGPFVTKGWRGQHPGRVRFAARGAKAFTSEGGSAENEAASNPVGVEPSCRTVDGADDPGAATWRLPAAKGRGYTLMGSPTISARLRIEGEFPQIVGRLWDVAPDGQQTLVSHGIYRPKARPGRSTTFQIEPAGWHFAPGHVPKLELLGRDSPYARASNGTFKITARALRLVLPTRQRKPR
jgi:dienelactone hydrolase